MKENGRAVCFPAHKNQRAATFFFKFGRQIFKRFTSFEEASRFLNGVRFKNDEGTYDSRDYKRDNCLGFANLAEKHLEYERHDVTKGALLKIRCDLEKAKAFFGNTNVKEIRFAHLQDFFMDDVLQELSGKTRHNIRTNLRAFWNWLLAREEISIEQMPKMPVVKYELGWRKTIDQETQDAIVDEVHRSCGGNKRIWLGIRWLCTYISIRPAELPGILEEDIDLDRGILVIRDHQTRRYRGPELVPLLDTDMELMRSLPRGFPQLPFFRMDVASGSRPAGSPFGQKMFRKWWDRACKNLGIVGVDLYGGARHSTHQVLRQCGKNPEEIQRLSMHSTSKAGMRYLEVQLDELRSGYALTDRKNIVSDIKPRKPSRK
jgi:integrase